MRDFGEALVQTVEMAFLVIFLLHMHKPQEIEELLEAHAVRRLEVVADPPLVGVNVAVPYYKVGRQWDAEYGRERLKANELAWAVKLGYTDGES